jgi:hypothetical protein
MSKNIVETDTLQMTIWRRVACWISNATRSQGHARTRAPIHTHPSKTHTHTHGSTQTYACPHPRVQSTDHEAPHYVVFSSTV